MADCHRKARNPSPPADHLSGKFSGCGRLAHRCNKMPLNAFASARASSIGACVVAVPSTGGGTTVYKCVKDGQTTLFTDKPLSRRERECRFLDGSVDDHGSALKQRTIAGRQMVWPDTVSSDVEWADGAGCSLCSLSHRGIHCCWESHRVQLGKRVPIAWSVVRRWSDAELDRSDVEQLQLPGPEPSVSWQLHSRATR